MRRLLLIGLFFVIPSAQAIAPGPARIEVTIRQLGSVTQGPRTIRSFSILNRPAYRRPIGEAVLVCWQANPHLFDCRQTFRFSRGQVVTAGLVSNLNFYALAVVGGTGYYDTVGGSSVVQQIGGDAWAATISLQGFG